MFLMAKLRLTDKEDNQIAMNTEASTINDCLFSALKSMKMFINDKPIVSMPHFGYQQYFSKKLASDTTAVDSYLTTEGYYVSILVKFFDQFCTPFLLQEDDTGFFDSCQSGTPEEYAPNSGYRERKKQFAKEIPILNPSTQEVTG